MPFKGKAKKFLREVYERHTPKGAFEKALRLEDLDAQLINSKAKKLREHWKNEIQGKITEPSDKARISDIYEAKLDTEISEAIKKTKAAHKRYGVVKNRFDKMRKASKGGLAVSAVGLTGLGAYKLKKKLEKKSAYVGERNTVMYKEAVIKKLKKYLKAVPYAFQGKVASPSSKYQGVKLDKLRDTALDRSKVFSKAEVEDYKLKNFIESNRRDVLKSRLGNIDARLKAVDKAPKIGELNSLKAQQKEAERLSRQAKLIDQRIGASNKLADIESSLRRRKMDMRSTFKNTKKQRELDAARLLSKEKKTSSDIKHGTIAATSALGALGLGAKMSKGRKKKKRLEKKAVTVLEVLNASGLVGAAVGAYQGQKKGDSAGDKIKEGLKGAVKGGLIAMPAALGGLALGYKGLGKLPIKGKIEDQLASGLLLSSMTAVPAAASYLTNKPKKKDKG